MGNSLRDQLLKAGLVDSKKVKQAISDKRRETKQQRQGKADPAEENRQRAQRAQAEKAERDRQLNRERQALEAQKAVAAQVRQLIESNRLATGDGETPFNFVHNGKVKRLYVSDDMRDQISRGRVAIVKLDRAYVLVPREVAEKIRQRDEKAVALCQDPAQDGGEPGGDDPYAAYQVPDDLMW